MAATKASIARDFVINDERAEFWFREELRRQKKLDVIGEAVEKAIYDPAVKAGRYFEDTRMGKLLSRPLAPAVALLQRASRTDDEIQEGQADRELFLTHIHFRLRQRTLESPLEHEELDVAHREYIAKHLRDRKIAPTAEAVQQQLEKLDKDVATDRTYGRWLDDPEPETIEHSLRRLDDTGELTFVVGRTEASNDSTPRLDQEQHDERQRLDHPDVQTATQREQAAGGEGDINDRQQKVKAPPSYTIAPDAIELDGNAPSADFHPDMQDIEEARNPQLGDDIEVVTDAAEPVRAMEAESTNAGTATSPSYIESPTESAVFDAMPPAEPKPAPAMAPPAKTGAEAVLPHRSPATPEPSPEPTNDPSPDPGDLGNNEDPGK
ncbi:MAG: hypothetical protein H0W90_04110 [Actinobacteria bacterium]|nr:hypothetical protein [Actinomycetota bacterium]